MAAARETVPFKARAATRASPAFATLLALVTVAFLLAELALAAAVGDFAGSGLAPVFVTVPFAVVGLVVARRQPDNPIGWLLLVSALLYTVEAAAGLYAVLALDHGHGDLPAVRVAVAVAPFGWMSLILFLPLVILLFPDGHVPSPRWRFVLYGYLAVWAVVLAATFAADLAAFTHRSIRIDSTGELAIFETPTGWYASILHAAIVLYVAFGVSFVVAQAVAYRRATGEHRQQVKWLMLGAAVSIAGLALTITAGGSTPFLRFLGAVGFLAAVALPVGVGFAILRYRLYDVDRLISRTLSYAIVTGLLVGIFAAIVVLTTQVLPFSSPVGVAASTLSAAALFNPLRRRVQRVVDRRFNRARYDAEAIAAAFSARLREAVALEAVQSELLSAVERAIEPASASVWLRPD
ncbi:MAG TPA: hypothetical protein VH063_00380 [Gaiellaceae bacterium]|jgi:hypothetical protein|nr:hypothetical protein [Gaiellaceae bacterium]